MYIDFVLGKFIEFITSVNLKLKLPVILPGRWVYLGIAETCNLGQASYRHITVKGRKRRRGTLFHGGGGGRGSWEGCFEGKSSEEKQGFAVMEGSHRLSCRGGDFWEEAKPVSSPLGPVTDESLLRRVLMLVL